MKRGSAILFAIAALAIASQAWAAGNVVISQIYGGGGNTGAPWTNDYVEVFNRSGSTQDMTGWTVQYASAAGNSWAAATFLSGYMLPAGGYALIQLASNAAVGSPLPASCNAGTGTINMAAGAGKVALCSNGTALTGTCPTGGAIVDFVGYGTTANCSETANAPGASNTTAVLRKGAGFQDSDDNSADFTAGSAVPCALPTPTLNHTWGVLKTLYR